MQSYLDFEKPVADLEGKIAELKAMAATDQAVSIDEEVNRLSSRADEALVEIYKRLTPWQKTQVARHPQRPHFSDYVRTLITEWQPLAGDRKFAEDAAIQAGFGRFNGQSVAVIGQEKGNSTESRLKHNFGMARPEGYRKAVRVMEMADRFNIPVISFVDTAGAYPGIGAEERGQAEAIARSTEKSLELGVPNIAIIIGEGGSGGAIAIATANRVLMLEHAIYGVISPEAGASILFRDAAKAQDMATIQKITAQDLLGFKVIDGIIAEPTGGAHRHPDVVMNASRDAIAAFLRDFANKSRLEVREQRREKFMAIGTNI
ncbi:acetyl-CoA carboxylase carboxyltransferase subunit alpha [Devosia sp. FKR38]|uniref:acetyl-CoA carboxylase carboxyltransferase subunit alpha n=1 Tax=Devosia sp. FKR38 TaxID=2562312 RepID=UPI0010C0237C|nr:acetyl-CoA carboxylase carboxyltransferase subunit alpha [Devosia sp. FKR38]